MQLKKILSAFRQRSASVRYIKNTSWLIGEQTLRLLIGLFIGVWIARYLGPSDFGLLSYVLALTSVFGGITKLGLDGVVVRSIVNTPEITRLIVGSAFRLRLISSVSVIFVLLSTLPAVSDYKDVYYYAAVVSIAFIFQAFEVVEFYLQSEVLGKIISRCKVTQLLLSSGIKLYLIGAQADLIWFFAATVIDAASLGIIYLVVSNRLPVRSFFTQFDWDISKRLLKDSWPLLMSGLAVTIYMRTDQLMIKEMLGDYELGVYSAAVRISEALYFIPVIIATSLLPAILRAKLNSNRLYLLRLQRLYSFLIWLAVAVALPATFLGDWIVMTLFGQEFDEGGVVLVVHAWASVFVFVGVASGKWYIAENLQNIAMVNTTVGAVSNVALNLALIPRFGIIGAALATVASYGVAAYLMNAFWARTRINFMMITKSIIFLRVAS